MTLKLVMDEVHVVETTLNFLLRRRIFGSNNRPKCGDGSYPVCYGYELVL